MKVAEFIEGVSGFHRQTKVEQVLLLAWHLHAHKGVESFSPAALREVFKEAGIEAPDLSVYLPRLAGKKPPQLLQARGAYRLDSRERRRYDQKYGNHPTTVAVTSLLSGLPAKVPDLAERAFLLETINCYRVKAYRAATVMAWNLAFDHVLRWVINDATRLTKFNASLQAKYPKKQLSISVIEEFEELKEHEAIEVMKHAGLFSSNIAGILQEKLKRRNRAAHPSNIEVTQHQADDTISDLVTNVVLALT